MTVDYLIVGQGICGTLLSRNLLRAGKTVHVIDESHAFTASKVASGVINPITGRRMVRTWEIEQLMPFAVNLYRTLEKELKVSLVQQCNILDFHPTPQMMIAFAERIPDEKEYLKLPENPDQWKPYFNYEFGVGEINPCWLIDLNTLLQTWRQYLQQAKMLSEQTFHWKDLSMATDHIRYGNITAEKIICCEGVAGFDNPYFQLLPYAHNKGEAIIAAIPDLPRSHIFKQGINLVPWKDGLWWIGSTYEWEYTDLLPSPGFKAKVETQLQHWLQVPFNIVDHIASERPANMERRPFSGLHPVFPTIGLLNGMGTKGCSLAPYFAAELSNHLVQGSALTPQVDVKRFSRILGTKK